MSRLTEDVRLVMRLLHQLCTERPPATRSACDPRPENGQQQPRAHLTDSPKCPSRCSPACGPGCQHTARASALHSKLDVSGCSHTRGSQTERSLIEDLLSKMPDSGSPPPNSGYSSSSSNEERVKLLIGLQTQRNAEDSESASDDSVLRASLAFRSTSSRDTSPFKGGQRWATVQSTTQPSGGRGSQPPPKSSENTQCAIDMETASRIEAEPSSGSSCRSNRC